MAKTIKKKEDPATFVAQEQAATISETTERLAGESAATRTSRHGIATPPSLWADINRLAEIKHESVNGMINRLLQEEIDRNADILAKYKDFLGEIDL